LTYPKEIASREKTGMKKVEKALTKDVFVHVLENLKKGKISENQIKHVLEKIVKGEDQSEAVKIQKKDMRHMDEEILKIIKDKPGLSMNAYMGLIMKELRGKADAKQVSEIIKKHVG
jgi:Asp-tRNA(Asn)/Glu-tRNA(Gln) amidotransferase B subunit